MSLPRVPKGQRNSELSDAQVQSLHQKEKLPSRYPHLPHLLLALLGLTLSLILAIYISHSISQAQANDSSLHQSSTSSTTVTLFPTMDTYLFQGLPQADQVLSDQPLLVVGRDEFAQEFMALLHFDLSNIPTGVTVTGATFEMSLEGGEPGDEAICIYRISTDWRNSVTWNSRPELDEATCHSTQTIGSDFGQIQRWSGLEALAQRWADGSAANFGMALRSSTLNAANKNFTSSEGNIQPRLIISYAEPTAPPSHTNTPTATEIPSTTVPPTPVPTATPVSTATPTRISAVEPTSLPSAPTDPAVGRWTFESGNPLAGWQGTHILDRGPDARTLAACTWRDPATSLPMGDLITGDRVRLPNGKRLARLGGDYWHAPIYDIGQQGNCRLDTWYAAGDDVEVRLRSPEFRFDQEFLTLLVGGGGSDETQVRLMIGERVIYESNGSGHFAMQRLNWDLEPYRGQMGYLLIEDTFTKAEFERLDFNWQQERNTILTDRYNCLMVRENRHRRPQDGTYLDCVTNSESHLQASNETIFGAMPWIAIDDVRGVAYPVGQEVTPVWGMADFHAHLVAELGLAGIYPGNFDGLLMEGIDDPNRVVEEQCQETVDEELRLQVGLLDLLGLTISPSDPCRSITLAQFCSMAPLSLVSESDPSAEVVTLSIGLVSDEIFCQDRLSFHDEMPQKLHESWLYRAWQGGLRLVIMDVLNNESMPQAANCSHILECSSGRAQLGLRRPVRPIGADTDEIVIERQIDAIKRWAAINEWAEVVLSPADARQAVQEGKMAIILGAEVDRLAHATIFDVVRGRGYADIAAFTRAVQDDPSVASSVREELRTAISTYLIQLKEMGVRHIFPIHLVDNIFGGSAIYDRKFDIQNRHMNGRYMSLTNGWDQGVRYRLDFDDSFMTGVLERGLDVPSRGGTGSDQIPTWPLFGHINEQALTPVGELLMEVLMEQGMIIDIDHMSERAKDRVFALAAARDYPIMASHTGFRQLTYGARPTFDPVTGAPIEGYISERIYDGGNDDAKRLYGTSDEHKLTSERSLSPGQTQAIAASGGVIGAGINTDPVQHSWRGIIPNNCDGTSVSFLQSYLYGIEQLGGRGIGLGTDVELVGIAGLPHGRFGPGACRGSLIDSSTFNVLSVIGTENAEDDFRKFETRYQASHQRNGVSYEGIPRPFIIDGARHWLPYTGLLTPYNKRFETDDGAVDGTEREMWLGAAIFAAGADIEDFDSHCGDSCFSYPKIKAFASGLKAAAEGHTMPDGRGSHGWRAYQAWLRGECPAQLNNLPEANLGSNYPTGYREESGQYDDDEKALRVWCLYQEIDGGDNIPLHRSVLAGRDFDVNVDGVAHYGLMPDFVQDMANVLRAYDAHPNTLAPLMQSAEHLIQMWERTEARAQAIRGESDPTAPEADRYETHDDLDTVTALTHGWTHTCTGAIAGLTRTGACQQIFENDVQEGQVTDSWRVEIDNLSLHSLTDRDYFQIQLPDIIDPEQGGRADIRPQFPPFQDDNGDGIIDNGSASPVPMPECGTIERRASNLIPTEAPFPVTVEVASSLFIRMQPVDGATDLPSVAPFYLYPAAGQRLLTGGRGIDCPQATLGSDTLTFSLGRINIPRDIVGRYKLILDYETTILRSGEPSPPDHFRRLPCFPAIGNHLIPRGPGGTFTEIGLPGLPMGGGFPNCFPVPNLGDAVLELTHPLIAGRSCLVGGCGESLSFNWPAGAGRFDMSLVSNGGLEFRLVDRAGNVLGEAAIVPPVVQAAAIEADSTTEQETPLQQRLAVDNLPAGLYYLAVTGEESSYLVLFTPIEADVESDEQPTGKMVFLPLVTK